MLGFFELHLKGKGHGMPVAEEPYTTLPEEKLLVFEPGKRPDEVCSLAAYLQKKGQALNAALYARESFAIEEETKKLSDVLKLEKSLKIASCTEPDAVNGWRRFQLEFNDNSVLPLVVREGNDTLTVFTHLSGKAQISEKNLSAGQTLALLDLSWTGELAPEPPERVMQFHQTARRYMWLGKTLIGRWTSELCAVVDFLAKAFPGKKIILHGCKETALASLFCSIFSEKVSKVIMEDAPVSYKFCSQSDFFGMGFFIPGILKWGDIPLACAMTKAELEWITPRNQDGTPAEIPSNEILTLKRKF